MASTLTEIMTQRCAIVEAVITADVMIVAANLTHNWNITENYKFLPLKGLFELGKDELSNADINDLKLIIKPLGNYNKKASNVLEIAKILHNEYHALVRETLKPYLTDEENAWLAKETREI